jgi:hypothetical protein
VISEKVARANTLSISASHLLPLNRETSEETLASLTKNLFTPLHPLSALNLAGPLLWQCAFHQHVDQHLSRKWFAPGANSGHILACLLTRALKQYRASELPPAKRRISCAEGWPEFGRLKNIRFR